MGGMGLAGPGMTMEHPRRLNESTSFPLPPQLSSSNSYPPSFAPEFLPHQHRRNSTPFTKSPASAEPSLGMNTATGGALDAAAAGKLTREIMAPMLAQVRPFLPSLVSRLIFVVRSRRTIGNYKRSS